MYLIFKKIFKHNKQIAECNVFSLSLIWAVLFAGLTILAWGIVGTGLGLIIGYVSFGLWCVGNLWYAKKNPLLIITTLGLALFVVNAKMERFAYVVQTATNIPPFEIQVLSNSGNEMFYISIPDLVEVEKQVEKHQANPYLISASTTDRLFTARFICGDEKINATCAKIIE